MRIRKATPEESSRLTQIAHEAKRHWGYPESWIEHWQADLTITSDFIGNNDVYVAEEDGEVVGFYALAIKKDVAELEHLWVAPKYIGTGVGKELFVHAMQKAAREDVSVVEISSDPNAEGFYRRMGAQRIGEVTSEVQGSPRVLPKLKVDLGP